MALIAAEVHRAAMHALHMATEVQQALWRRVQRLRRAHKPHGRTCRNAGRDTPQAHSASHRLVCTDAHAPLAHTPHRRRRARSRRAACSATSPWSTAQSCWASALGRARRSCAGVTLTLPFVADLFSPSRRSGAAMPVRGVWATRLRQRRSQCPGRVICGGCSLAHAAGAVGRRRCACRAVQRHVAMLHCRMRTQAVSVGVRDAATCSKLARSSCRHPTPP
jgi:hypothetical protein